MPKSLTRESLSSHDQRVLESIFNPLELTSTAASVIDIDTPDDVVLVDKEEDTEIIKESKMLEFMAVRLADSGQLPQALEKFTEALKIAPHRASIYNNRAQALRLAGQDQEALNDLNNAIESCSSEQLRTKCHALCQRGVLHRKKDDIDAARFDFENAARLGSKFAKAQLVEINPFAALCNQMLRQAFEQLQ